MIELDIENDTDPFERQRAIKEICNDNKDLIKLCNKLEEIITMEQIYTQY